MSSVERIELPADIPKTREEYCAELEAAFPLACGGLSLCFQARGISARLAQEITSDEECENAKAAIEAIDCTGQAESKIKGCGSASRCGMKTSFVNPLQK